MNETETVTEIPSLEYTIDRKNLRAVFTVNPSLGDDVEVDVPMLQARFDDWLNKGVPLVIIGCTMKLYEIKEETWRERPSML